MRHNPSVCNVVGMLEPHHEASQHRLQKHRRLELLACACRLPAPLTCAPPRLQSRRGAIVAAAEERLNRLLALPFEVKHPLLPRMRPDEVDGVVLLAAQQHAECAADCQLFGERLLLRAKIDDGFLHHLDHLEAGLYLAGRFLLNRRDVVSRKGLVEAGALFDQWLDEAVVARGGLRGRREGTDRHCDRGTGRTAVGASARRRGARAAASPHLAVAEDAPVREPPRPR
mmetsp:Transcript_24677/g.52447  ORF Transcript_24677/g.52447 Transcript_24677/m.52447 type:complete len:228 (-) Transcript_24677:1227-1910(-)